MTTFEVGLLVVNWLLIAINWYLASQYSKLTDEYKKLCLELIESQLKYRQGLIDALQEATAKGAGKVQA